MKRAPLASGAEGAGQLVLALPPHRLAARDDADTAVGHSVEPLLVRLVVAAALVTKSRFCDAG